MQVLIDYLESVEKKLPGEKIFICDRSYLIAGIAGAEDFDTGKTVIWSLKIPGTSANSAR